MNAPIAHVGVEPGPGVVARVGAAVALIAETDPAASSDFTSAVVAALDAGETTSPEELVWALARLLSAHGAAAPAFGLAIRTTLGYRLLLHGAVWAVVAGPDGNQQLSGDSALTWLDRLVPEPVGTVAMSLNESGTVNADPRSDLRAGLVPGGGLVLTPSVAGAAVEPVPEPAPQPEPTPASAPAPEPATPLEPETAPAPAPEPTTPSAAERGGDAHATADLAAPERPASPAVSDTPTHRHRPPASETVAVRAIAALVSDDGTRTPLDRAYVFGREPHHDNLVTGGQATPIVVRDPDNLVSRVQVYLAVDSGVVTIRDVASANGTFVAAPGAPDWVRLGEAPAELPLGWSMRMGRRVFTHTGAPG